MPAELRVLNGCCIEQKGVLFDLNAISNWCIITRKSNFAGPIDSDIIRWEMLQTLAEAQNKGTQVHTEVKDEGSRGRR